MSQYYTFEHEDKLPQLPVPSLIATTQQLLTALKPLLSAEEFDLLIDESTEFVNNELINLIQQHLVALQENEDIACYLDIVHNNVTPAIYGESRGDVLPRNPYLILEEDPYSKTINPPNQAQRSANLINSSLKFIVSLRNESLKPDLTPKNGNPLTMACYKNLFGTTRIPDLSEEHSTNVAIKKYQDINDSRHILIICNNQYYTLEVLTEYTEEAYAQTKTKHKIWFNDLELSIILQAIIDDAKKVDRIESINNAIGSITTQSLKHWKAARLELKSSNAENLKKIDDALFVVVMDSNSPKDDQERTEVISHGSSVLSGNVQVGTCTSRWYDKLQLIVTENSVAGVVWESMIMDSTAILRFISDIYTDSVLKLAKNINGSEYTLFDSNVKFISSTETKPDQVKLTFNKTPEVQNFIHLSETRLADIINQHEYKTLNIRMDSTLVKSFSLSVDSILQVAFQITNYSLYGRMINSLEPITTRKFKNARTELVPIQNDYISNLVKLYITSASASEKFEAFSRCCQDHLVQYRAAMNGKGFERHLMSIIHIIKRPSIAKRINEINSHLPPIPDLTKTKTFVPLLLDPTIEKLQNPELLISNCGNPALLLFGITPAVDQGFGIGYIIHSDKVIITICSKHRQTARFLDTFHRVIHDIKQNLKQRSNLLLSISDSEQRSMELKRLRIEHELNTVESDNVAQRHPIPLTVAGESIPIESIKLESLPMIKSESDVRSQESEEEEEKNENYELMGGYGYFVYGELDLRSDEISRNASYIHSRNDSYRGSRVTSAVHSRHHSATNLAKLALSAHHDTLDIKEKQSLSDQIRDKLSKSTDSIPSLDASLKNLAMTQAGPSGSEVRIEVENTDEPKKKGSIGRKLDLSKHRIG
ncbi:uncharacterized protein J8A68_002122 [[Candida] subhashii]|uniref:Choline/carnitine acyltransferase domain-containing protein n=1 Tax=[Candida] subhashii TaxID=561895 RepID=A0A8J5UYH6_9ASCO|nr:uncharacterized protein J8A68_002122 [[Candida] subhashii]KAG7664340.1 hypothetical protein J8A68_002122 [[Candida] subhashii]